MPIPKSVTLAELTTALEPLCDLLGTSPRNFYDEPGMLIGHRSITFVVPARHEESPKDRAPAARPWENYPPPQRIEEDGDPVNELGYVVRVEVILP